MKRRHLTPQEIIAQCKAVARESRMAERTPWTAMSILCSYVVLKKEGFKGKRILKLINRVNEMQEQIDRKEISLESIRNRLQQKAEWTITHERYTEADIVAKKGSYKYWLDKQQIAPQNAINELATKYMLCFFTALMDEYGYGKDRLTRVQDYLNELLILYQQDKTTIREWNKELFDEAGIVIEMPIDPLTQTRGSLMTN